jgi:hypothetical protein
MEYVEFLPGAIAAVAMTVRIVSFFTVERKGSRSAA